MDIPIIFENEDFLIINKPAGLVVHADGKTKEKTLVDWIQKHYPELSEVGEDMHFENKGEEIIIKRPGIVHRIDRDTSGILLIAKTQQSFLYFKNLFKEQKIHKKYQALVYGLIRENEGTISEPIGRHPKDFRKKMAGRYSRGTQRPAETHYQVLARYKNVVLEKTKNSFEKNFTLLECSPKTGRTHQIRVHLKWMHHPIVGDTLYEGRGNKHPFPIQRTMLHAHKISFIDRRGEQQHFVAELPFDFKETLRLLTLYKTSL